MATIGLDKLYYAKITEDASGNETYGTPLQLAKAMTAELSVELAEATLYADDGPAEIVKEFKSGTLALGIDDIGVVAAEDLTGAKLDDNHVVVSASEDGGSPVAVGFREWEVSTQKLPAFPAAHQRAMSPSGQSTSHSSSFPHCAEYRLPISCSGL